ILDEGKHLDRPHDNRAGELVDPSLAHQPRPSVDLRAAGSALRRLAVPAARQGSVQVSLDVVDPIEDDHALRDGHLVGHELPALGIAPEHLKCRVRHAPLLCYALTSATSSTGICGTGRVATLICPASLDTTRFLAPQEGSGSGKSRRQCAPRLSLRSIADLKIA